MILFSNETKLSSALSAHSFRSQISIQLVAVYYPDEPETCNLYYLTVFIVTADP